MDLKVGDKVKPVGTYDFDKFGGPKNKNDRGEIIDIGEVPFLDGLYAAIVRWESSGEETDHAINIEGDENNPMVELFGVELAA